MSENNQANESDIFARTLRTVAVLVGACVLFVGTLSTAAVLIASKAVGPSSQPTVTEARELSAASKKPLSI